MHKHLQKIGLELKDLQEVRTLIMMQFLQHLEQQEHHQDLLVNHKDIMMLLI